MVFYFNRDTGRRVSKSTWKRNKAHGGTKYVRRSTKKKEKPKKEIEPKTFDEWQGLYEEHSLRGYDEELEVETSVDY